MATSALRRDAAAAAGPYAWYVALLLASAHLVSFVDRFLMSLVMEPLKADLHVSDAQLGLLQGTGFVILYTVVALPLGRMADQVNRRNLIIAGIVLWSLATASCGLASSFGSLFLARVAVGFGEAALVPSAMSLLAAYFPRRQLGRAVSIFTTGSSLGKSAALIGGGVVLAMLTAAGGLSLIGMRLAPWQGTFVVMALPGLILAVLLLTVREPARPTTTLVRPGVGEMVRYLGAHRAALLLHSAASALVVLLIQSLAAWAPSFFGRFFGMTAPAAGVAVGSVILIAAPLGHIAGGMLTDLCQARGMRSPAAPVMVIGMLAVIPAVLLFGSCRSLGTALAAYGLLTFFTTLSAPASLAGIQMVTPDRLRGIGSALFLTVTTFIGIGVGPPLIGVVTDLLGGPQQLRTAMMLIFPAVAAIGVLLALASRGPFARTAAAVAATH